MSSMGLRDIMAPRNTKGVSTPPELEVFRGIIDQTAEPCDDLRANWKCK